jgi:hypothetical protein
VAEAVGGGLERRDMPVGPVPVGMDEEEVVGLANRLVVGRASAPNGRDVAEAAGNAEEVGRKLEGATRLGPERGTADVRLFTGALRGSLNCWYDRS